MAGPPVMQRIAVVEPGTEVTQTLSNVFHTKVGVSGCVIPYGKGQIILYCLPELVQSLRPGNLAISPVICQRLLGDALRPAPTNASL